MWHIYRRAAVVVSSVFGVCFPMITFAAVNYCEPVHGPDAPSVVLGTLGNETLAKAYAAVVKQGGGVLTVPYGTYGCEHLIWAGGRNSTFVDVTIRGVPGPNGEKPVFACNTGTWVNIGPPLFEADGVTPAPTRPVSFIVDNIELRGWTRWVTGGNIKKIAFHNVLADGRYNGIRVTGKGFVMGERVGPNQLAESEICDSEIGYAGASNQDHPSYTHGGPSLATGRFGFIRSICRNSNASHCIKTTAAGDVLIEDSQFYNTCKVGEFCGTQTLNWVAATKRATIRRNTFVRGDPSNPNANIPGVSMIANSNRKFFFDGPTIPVYNAFGTLIPNVSNLGGGLFAPLYDPGYLDQEFQDLSAGGVAETYWNAVVAGGDTYANPYLRLSVIHDNTFINHATKLVPAILSIGTYPVTAIPTISDCLTPLRTPSNWVESARLVVANNTFVGNFPADTPDDDDPYGWLSSRTSNYCNVYPTPSVETGVPTWDLGGNGPEGTSKVVLPDWVTGVANTPVIDVTPPTITILSPLEGAIVSGVTTVRANVADGSGILSATISVDGVSLGDDLTAPYEWSWDATSAAAGAHTISLIARDNEGNTSAPRSVSVTIAATSSPSIVDATAPVVSSLTISSISASSATVSWATNESSDAQVEYGVTLSYGQESAVSASMGMVHSVLLTGLQSGTPYHIRAISRDETGNIGRSIDQVFTTAVASVRTTPTIAPSGGGGGGGGGGTVSIPVPTPSVLTPPIASSGSAPTPTVTVSWSVPSDVELLTTFVLRKSGGTPANITDGTIVATGRAGSYSEPFQESLRYSYAVFGIPTRGLAVSIPSFVSVSGSPASAGVVASSTVADASIEKPRLVLMKNLKVGMRDPEVSQLQGYLQNLGYFPASETPTGFFGRMTEASVVAYQRANAIIPALGFVGPLTREKLASGGVATQASSVSREAPSITLRVLRAGMEGDDVLMLQQKLQSLGHLDRSITPQGHFGPATLKAIQRYQCVTLSVCSGTPDTTGYGLLGPRTRNALGF